LAIPVLIVDDMDVGFGPQVFFRGFLAFAVEFTLLYHID